MAHIIRIGVVPVYLMLCLMLGGASLEGYWVNMALQLLALPIIAWSLLARRRTSASNATRQLLVVLALAILVIAVQLIPLPPGLWTSLPGRDGVAEGFRLLGLPLPWLPLSLAPKATIASALWLLPAIAVLLGIVKLGGYKASLVAWSILVVTALAVLLGTLQVLGGGGSQWQLYEVTNYGSATGFFSNSNHMATLLVVCIPFLAALYLSAVRAGGSAQRASGLLVVLAGTLAVILVGLAINGSVAGVGLGVPVVVVSLLMILARKRQVPWWTAGVPLLLALGAVLLVFNGPLGNDLTGEAAKAQGSRHYAFTISWEAAKDFLPVGAGIGSFVPVFRSYEDLATIDRMYMNHAHNDYLELLVETGLLGLIVLALFLLWWGWRTIAIWSSSERDYFARAATIATAAVLAHSLVDYPLRTAAISALFAACCGLMAEPRSSVRKKQTAEKKAKHLSAD